MEQSHRAGRGEGGPGDPGPRARWWGGGPGGADPDPNVASTYYR